MANEFRGPAWECKIVSACGAIDTFALMMIHGSAMYRIWTGNDGKRRTCWEQLMEKDDAAIHGGAQQAVIAG
jgi:hypothetical protein